LRNEGFDFESRPTFGFSPAPPPPTQDDGFYELEKSARRGGAVGLVSSDIDGEDFFDVAESAWGKGGAATATKALVPSKKDKRVATSSEPKEPDLFQPANFANFTASPTQRPAYSSANGIAAAANSNHRGGRRPAAANSSNNMDGWMSEMPGYIAPRQQQQDEDEEEDAFELRVQRSEPVSPLTIATKKPINTMRMRTRR
jgi:hypothetical protein